MGPEQPLITWMWCEVSTFKAPAPMLPASITLTPISSNWPAMFYLQPQPCGEGMVSLLKI